MTTENLKQDELDLGDFLLLERIVKECAMGRFVAISVEKCFFGSGKYSVLPKTVGCATFDEVSYRVEKMNRLGATLDLGTGDDLVTIHSISHKWIDNFTTAYNLATPKNKTNHALCMSTFKKIQEKLGAFV